VNIIDPVIDNWINIDFATVLDKFEKPDTIPPSNLSKTVAKSIFIQLSITGSIIFT
jgi:hypothetical protein